MKKNNMKTTSETVFYISIIYRDIVAANKSLNKGKAAIAYRQYRNNGGDYIIDLMHRICSHIWETSK